VRYFDRIQHPEYTDLAVVMGPNVRWTEYDYLDLQQHAPEVLLGYRVLLMTPDSAPHKLRGRWIKKLVLLKGLEHKHPRIRHAIQDAIFMTEIADGKVEEYDVYRGNDPIVRRIG
jgi:hypothetical protein